MKNFFKLVGFDPEKSQSTVKTEFVAGIVTFLSMAYILTVNPNQIFGSGSEYWASSFIATALGAVIGTLLMAFVAKMPLAQASGMGLNSMLGGLISGYGLYGKFSPGQAFMLVFISGLFFLALSLFKIKGKTIRELAFDGMPVSVRSAISVGIGLFIAYIGFQNAGVIVYNGHTQVGFVDFTNWGDQLVSAEVDPWAAAKTATVAIAGLFLITILERMNVKGAIIAGILGATAIGIPLGVTDLSILAGNSDVSWKFWDNFANFFTRENSVFGSLGSVFTEGLLPEGVSVFTIIMIVMTMSMIDMFDTMGTIVGCCSSSEILMDKDGKPRNYSRIMLTDAVATCAGAMIGTSTVTTFVESSSGVTAGGRTGLTAFSSACFFFLSMFALPFFAMIPSAAAASALIYVGVLMMKNNIKGVDFTTAINATSAFLTISVMVLSYSITTGIGVGMLAYTIMSVIVYFIDLITAMIKKTNPPKWDVSIVTIIVSIFFIIYFFVPASLF